MASTEKDQWLLKIPSSTSLRLPIQSLLLEAAPVLKFGQMKYSVIWDEPVAWDCRIYIVQRYHTLFAYCGNTWLREKWPKIKLIRDETEVNIFNDWLSLWLIGMMLAPLPVSHLYLFFPQHCNASAGFPVLLVALPIYDFRLIRVFRISDYRI